MSSHADMLERATELVVDARETYNMIEAYEPDRLPIAQQMLDDTVRVYTLIESSQRLSRKASLEVEARLVRADLLARALQGPVQ